MPISTKQRIQRIGETANVQDFARFGTRLVGRYFTEQGEPQRAYLWEVNIQNDVNPMDSLQLYARDVTLPAVENDFITKEFMGQQFYYAGKESSQKAVSVTFWDDESLSVYSYFQLWMQWLARPDDGAQAYKENYAKDFVLSMKDTTDLFETGRFKLTKAWPTSLGEVSLSYESSEIMQFTVTLAYDIKYMGAG